MKKLCPFKTVRGWRLAWALLAMGPATGPGAEETPVVADMGPAFLLDWVRPEYPDEARKARLEGWVEVEFVVEADGRVTRAAVSESTDERFDAAALAAVGRWKFKPALEDGEPVASGLRAAVGFQLVQLKQKTAPLFPPMAEMPVPLPEIPAQPDRTLEPEYPRELEERKLPGVVNMEFTVDATGRVLEPRVLWATHPAFVATTLRTLEKAGFKPARQGPLIKSSRVKYPVGFGSVGARPSEILAANGLALVSREPVVLQPEPRMIIPPVFPREQLLAAESGRGEAEFTVDENGATKEIAIVGASHPAFGAALNAAIESWGFKPAQGENGPMAIRVRAVHEFTLPLAPPEDRLADRLKPGGEGIGGPKGLDGKLQPLWRGFPVYPHALREAKQRGEAQIEFIIDQDGRVRLPRIVSATAEPFGWAAATAVSQWVFERPMRQGQPVDVAVRVPVTFEPPR